jgi:hypothetical protein
VVIRVEKRVEVLDFKCDEGHLVEVLRGTNGAPLRMTTFLLLMKDFCGCTTSSHQHRAGASNKSGLTLVSGSGEMEALLLLDETGLEEHCLDFYGHC